MSESDTICLGDSSLTFRKLEPIARGGFGTVYKASRISSGKDIPTDQTFAVKEIVLKNEEIERLQCGLGGKAVLQRWKSIFDLKHPNILHYYQIKMEKSPYGGTVNLAMEFMADGDLDRFISQLRKREIMLLPNNLLHMTEQLAFGLDYLHQSNIIHGDLKPGNILLKPCPRRQWTLIIADLDDRIQMEENVTKSLDITQIRGTAMYMSPEMVARFVKEGCQKPGRKTDIWSVGCIILDLANCLYGNQQRSFWKKRLFSEEPFTISTDTTSQQIIIKIADGYIPIVSSEIPENLADMIKCCLLVDTAERTSAETLLYSVRYLLLKSMKAKSSALFCETYMAAKGDRMVVWTWGPSGDTIDVVNANCVVETNFAAQTEKRIAFPDVPEISNKGGTCPGVHPSTLNSGRKDYRRKRCVLLSSFNRTGYFVCAGFHNDSEEFKRSERTVLEMWKYNNVRFAVIDAITTKSPFMNWYSNWNATGTFFVSGSFKSEERAPCFYMWTVINMRFVEITSDAPLRAVQWLFVDEFTLHIYDSNADCYVYDAAMSPGILKPKQDLEEMPSVRFLHYLSHPAKRFAFQKSLGTTRKNSLNQKVT